MKVFERNDLNVVTDTLVLNVDLSSYRNRQWNSRAHYAPPALCERLIRLLTIHNALNSDYRGE